MQAQVRVSRTDSHPLACGSTLPVRPSSLAERRHVQLPSEISCVVNWNRFCIKDEHSGLSRRNVLS